MSALIWAARTTNIVLAQVYDEILLHPEPQYHPRKSIEFTELSLFERGKLSCRVALRILPTIVFVEL